MRTRFAELSLPRKILLNISCALTLLLGITGAIVPGNLLSAKDSNKMSDGVHNYARFRQPQDISASGVVAIWILRSFDDVERIIAGHSTAILLLWLASMCGALSYQLAQRTVKRMEQPGVIRQERNTGSSRLSASILHDLRNPAAAISAAAEMLVDMNLPPAHVKRLAGNIHRASRRIQEMLQDQLSVSRGESSLPEPSRLREIAEAACESLDATAESYGTTLAIDIAPVIELPLKRARMERALVNLISNAIEAMPDGGKVRISAQFAEGSVIVHVDDTGPGVSPEIRSRLFQPFVTAGKSDGVGLGLAFTRQTVLEHGGELWLDIAPGGGARFSLRLPGAYLVQLHALAV